MKLSLVVAQGVHQGKVIPITGQQFLIGRDPQCQLRPASPAVSKQHCAITVREGQVFVRDFGSTNGTAINEVPVDGEREMFDTDKLKVGPLEFILRIERVAAAPTPAPVRLPASANPTSSANKPTPTPAPRLAPKPIIIAAEPDADQLAAMLLAEDGDDIPSGLSPEVPEGTTVMEIPAIPGQPTNKPAAPANDPNTSRLASDILSKYMRRPRGT